MYEWVIRKQTYLPVRRSNQNTSARLPLPLANQHFPCRHTYYFFHFAGCRHQWFYAFDIYVRRLGDSECFVCRQLYNYSFCFRFVFFFSHLQYSGSADTHWEYEFWRARIYFMFNLSHCDERLSRHLLICIVLTKRTTKCEREKMQTHSRNQRTRDGNEKKKTGMISWYESVDGAVDRVSLTFVAFYKCSDWRYGQTATP